jgi:hypothetical protein
MKLKSTSNRLIRAHDFNPAEACTVWLIATQSTYGWISGQTADVMMVLSHDQKIACRAASAEWMRLRGIALDPEKQVVAARWGVVEPAPKMPQEVIDAQVARIERVSDIADHHMRMIHICDCQRLFINPAEHAQDCPYRVEYGRP